MDQLLHNEVFPEWNENSVNSRNLINHWNMNWVQFKDTTSHMCLSGVVVESWSLTQEELAGLMQYSHWQTPTPTQIPTPTKWVCNPFASVSVSVLASLNSSAHYNWTHFLSVSVSASVSKNPFNENISVTEFNEFSENIQGNPNTKHKVTCISISGCSLYSSCFSDVPDPVRINVDSGGTSAVPHGDGFRTVRFLWTHLCLECCTNVQRYKQSSFGHKIEQMIND